MSTDTHPTTVALKLSSWAAALAVVAGVMVLVGWTFDIAVLKSILPGWVSMKANTAVCFILSGVALWLTAHPRSAFNSPHSAFRILHSAFRIPQSFLALFCSLLVGLIGLLTLSEYILGWNLGIDQWLFREPIGTVGTPHPGRMTAETALLFVLLAAALWITVGSSKKHGCVLASKILSILVATLAVGEILSYLTPGLGPYVWFGFPIMSMHAATLFAVLGMAVIAVNWQRGILPWSLGSGTTVAFVCGMAVLVFVGLSINRSQFWLNETNRKITSSEEVLNEIVNIQLELTEAQAHARGYVITRDKGFLGAYLGDISVYYTKMDALRLRIAGNAQQQQLLSSIEANVDLLQHWTQQFIDVPQTRTTRRKIDVHGDEFMDNIHDTFDQIEDEHLQLIRELRQKSESVARFSYIAITIGTLVSLLIFMTVIFRLNSAVNERKRAEESLLILSQAVEQSPSSIVITDIDANIEYANAAFVETTGYSLVELIGQNPRLLHSGKTPGETYAQMWACLKRGDIWKGEFINQRRDGSDYIESVLISPVRQQDGRITHYLAIKDNITERRLAEEKLWSTTKKLHESQQLLEAIVENIPIMVFVKRANDLCFELFNRAGEKLLGYSRDDLLGKGDYDLWPKEQGDWFTAADRKVLASKEITEILEEPINTASGETRYLHTWKIALRDEDGNPAHLLGLSIDITEHKLADAKLAEQLDELRRWHDVTSGREERILDLKHEVNELLAKTGQPARYPSAESQDKTGRS